MARKVSVIIPNYNHARFLSTRLESVLIQEQFIDQIIILDDASTDNSLAIISQYKSDKIKLVVNPVNSGSVFKQWEKGLSFIDKTSLVWIAESDDFSDENFLKQVLEVFNDSTVVLAYTRSTDVDEVGKTMGLSYKELAWCENSFVKEGSEEIKEHLFKQCTIPNVSAVVFKNKFVDASFFEHKFKLCGDWYFYLRLLEYGRIAYISKPLNYHRFHPGTVRTKSLRSSDVLNERLAITKETSFRYKIEKSLYRETVVYQIKLFLSETPISFLLSKTGLKLLLISAGYGGEYAAIAFWLLSKRIINRVLKN